MEHLNIKNFFLFSLSVTLLFACGVGAFNIWKFEKEKARQLEAKHVTSLLFEEWVIENAKRKKIDEAYIDEFACIFSESPVSTKDLDKIEASMRLDGYNFAEIKEIRHMGWEYSLHPTLPRIRLD